MLLIHPVTLERTMETTISDIRQAEHDQQVELIMGQRLFEALYPVLIPIEHVNATMRARHREKIYEIARNAWLSFRDHLR